MKDWNILDGMIEFNYDDDGQQEWSLRELTRMAYNAEGVIVTMDGGAHIIPQGGGVVRTSSAPPAPSGSGDFEPGPNLFDRVVQAYILPSITHQVYSSNIFLNRLSNKGKRRPDPVMPPPLIYANRIKRAPSGAAPSTNNNERQDTNGK